MADRNLKDIIKFIDNSNIISDAEISDIIKQLKFSDVLDLVTAIKSNNIESGKDILKKYSDVFAQPTTQEASSIPTIKPIPSTTGQSSFPKVAPKNSPTISGQQTTSLPGQEEADLDQLMNDPSKQNDPNVRQIKNLLTRMQK